MAKNKRYTVKLKRKRKFKTNYKKRLAFLKSNKVRVVIRKSLNNIIVQLVEFGPKGDRIVNSTHSRNLKKFGWKAHLGNIPSAYLTGYLCGIKAKGKKIKEIIFDMGLYRPTKGSILYAALKGLIDAGLDVPHNKKIFPIEEQIKGKIISDFAKNLKKSDEEKYKKQFSKYIKEGFDIEKISEHFDEVKNKIEKDAK